MKKGKSILTRCLALALALVLIVSSANLSAALKVSANSETTVTVGELVAKNYELADWEEALLNTGFFGEEYSYTTPTADDDLVAINGDTNEITAKNHGQWIPVSADIMVDNKSVETVVITNNVGTYAYDGETFSVAVKYELNYEVSATEQQTVLNTSAYLVQGLENMAIVYDADSSLEIIEQAMPTLQSLCGKSIGGVSFGEDFVAAVKALQEDMDAHEGILGVRYCNNNYYEEGTEYLINQAGTYEVIVPKLYKELSAIANDPLTQTPNVDEYLRLNDKLDGTNNATLWGAFKGVLNTVVEKLEPAATADWHVDEIQAVHVSGTEYAELDALLANAGEPTKVSYVTSLKEAETTVHATQNMNSVLVSVELKVVADKADSAELVSGGDAGRAFLTLPQGATAKQVLAAIEESGIEESTKASWGAAFAAEHYVATASELPEKLNEDVVYVITYVPKTYTVNYVYASSEELPYGYQLTLPVHENVATYAYDYIVDGKAAMQGEVITIEGDTKIDRTEGKAYSVTTVYSAIGSSLGNDAAEAILSSGALKGDEVIYYRTPEAPTMSLSEKVLTVQASLASDYAGLSWVPYSYTIEGSPVLFQGNTASGILAREAQVDYALKLTNVDAAEAVKVLADAKDIYAEAAQQLEGMDYLLSKYDDIGTLNKSYLDALLGTINGFDFTPDDKNYNDASNLEMREYFGGIVSALLNTKANYIDRNTNNLMLYTMLTEYKNGGLAYYYKNSAEIYQQVSDLADYLTGLVGDPEKEAGLALLLSEMGKGDLVEKISKLGQAMTDTKANLLPTNAAIDTTKDLKALVKAVTSGNAPETEAEGTPYILSGKFTVVDDSAVALIAKIYVDGVEIDTVSATYDRWTKLDASMIADLQAKIDAKVNELGEKLPYYTVSGSASELSDMIGTELKDNLNVAVTCNAKQYTVKIEGEADQTVTINDLTVDLPQHADHPSTVYVYSVGETGYETSYSFTEEDLNTLFTNGSYTITRETLDLGEQQMTTALDALNNNTAGNSYYLDNGTLVANIAGTPAGMMAFATGLMDTGYGYIAINEHDLMYSVEGEGLKISIQALIDAILEDENFGSETLIALGNNGKGNVLNATLTLGMDETSIFEEDMPFVLNLISVPEQMATVAKGLEVSRDNLYFYSNGDHMYVYVNLPEKVYEVYLTAMWGIGELDKTDINAINNQIALNFLYDYVMLIAESDVTAMTFENTLRIFDEAANEALDKDIPDYDIAAYDKYLQLVKKALTSDGLVVEADEETMTLSVTGQGELLKDAIKKAGIDISTYENMIKEFAPGEILHGKVIAKLANTSVDFEALIIDVNAGIDGAKEIKNISNRDEAVNEAVDLIKGMGLANGIDYTTDLPARASEITGKAAIMLLDDVDGDLILNDTTVLDLNGKTINGSLIANGTVLVMDSTLDTANAGSITGNVSGNVIILAGNYNANVAAYLPDGYLQVNGNVQNALYTIESPNSGDLIVTVNTDVYMSESVDGYLPSVKTLAADLVVDVAFNYYLTAMLSVDGNTIFNIDFDDIVGVIDSNTKASDIINEILCMFDAKGTSAVYNAISADLLDFAAIEQALINGTKIVSYDLTVAPYGIEIEHITDGDYLTLNVGSVESHAKTFEIALKLDGDVNTARLTKVVGELADIVVAENTYTVIDLEQPYYSDRTLWLEGSAKASLDLDLSKNPAYQTIIAVVLAYGNSDKAEALVDAIGDQDALKEVFNTITVEEVFTALKALEREVNFTEMAESLGVDVDYSKAAEYENLIHVLLAAAGYALERLDITGYTDKTMGMIEEGDSGRYTLTKSAAKSGDITRRGFTLDASAVIEHVTLSVKIFADDCLWGDANHDGLVNAMDATLVLQYSVSTLAEDQFFCTLRTDVNGDGAINAMDATLILQHSVGTITKFPVEG